MDYFQGVVTEYLRADRAVFVNTECCIQLNPGANPDTSGPHWYCDAVAVNFRDESVSLCEVSYSQSLGALIKRLEGWSANWSKLREALIRDCAIPATWQVRPWLFVPADRQRKLAQKLPKLIVDGGMPHPLITTLESVVPWKYKSWNRSPTDESHDA